MKEVVSRMSKETTKVVTQFSDAIVVSFIEKDVKEIPQFLSDTHRLVATLANKNMLCRGAISYGLLYHDEDFRTCSCGCI
ncbi:hypothetical protein POKO110462_15080 [Pontibacter korlensis]|uniref:hypothetical protein n=1 Tax=Pontibacter korlensis TaxID=400092 RepID=UPI0011DD788B|nr:hypothetical protein [Pontibacter korlensis]